MRSLNESRQQQSDYPRSVEGVRSESRVLVAFNAPVPALPIDLFRILIGLLSSIYFLSLFFQADDFSSPHGFLDHELIQSIFWYTRLGLFQTGLPVEFFKIVFLLSSVASWLIVFGYWARPVAGLLYIVAVSSYRWNFIVAYVDDALMHLMLFWLFLLPTGRTLTLHGWVRDRHGEAERWPHVKVPGGVMRCFLANLALIYAVAGLWKWTSPMWREGIAVYAVLKLAISHAPEFWQLQHLPLLKLANYLALVLEPMFALVIILPTGHRLKWLLAAGLAAFHLGIVATLKIPFANIASVAAVVLIFRYEIMSLLLKKNKEVPVVAKPGKLRPREVIALLLVTLLTMAMLWDIGSEPWRTPSSNPSQSVAAGVQGNTQERTAEEDANEPRMAHATNPFYGPLWLMGFAQSYRLFDWIDDRNYHVAYDVVASDQAGVPQKIDSQELLPETLRAVLLQSYLHGVTWIRVPNQHLAELKYTVFSRIAQRYCHLNQAEIMVDVYAIVQRIDETNLEISQTNSERFMTFECQGSIAKLRYPSRTQMEAASLSSAE